MSCPFCGAATTAAPIARLEMQIDTLRAELAACREALIEVMDWIDAWEPSFIEANGWPDTKAKVNSAILGIREAGV